MEARANTSTLDTANGCAKWVVIGFVALAAFIGFGVWMGRSAETVRVTGNVHVSMSSACESPKLEIRPEGKAWQTVRFEASSWRAGQTCVLPLDVDLPPAARYTIRMDGVGVETIERAGDETTVRFELSW